MVFINLNSSFGFPPLPECIPRAKGRHLVIGSDITKELEEFKNIFTDICTKKPQLV